MLYCHDDRYMHIISLISPTCFWKFYSDSGFDPGDDYF